MNVLTVAPWLVGRTRELAALLRAARHTAEARSDGQWFTRLDSSWVDDVMKAWGSLPSTSDKAPKGPPNIEFTEDAVSSTWLKRLLRAARKEKDDGSG